MPGIKAPVVTLEDIRIAMNGKSINHWIEIEGNTDNNSIITIEWVPDHQTEIVQNKPGKESTEFYKERLCIRRHFSKLPDLVPCDFYTFLKVKGIKMMLKKLGFDDKHCF